MSALEHLTPDCTGEWRLTPAFRHNLIECEACGAWGAVTEERRDAALREKLSGMLLEWLAGEGMLHTGKAS